MRKLFSVRFLVGLLAMGLLCGVGCQPPSSSSTAETTSHSGDDHDHDHGDHDHRDHDHGDHDHGDHDHGDHDHDFKDLASAMVEIEELSNEITAAFVAGTPDDAHDSLHHIGEVLEATENLVKSSDLEDETKTSAMQAVETLFDSFTTLDDSLHAGDDEKTELDPASIKASVDAAIETLKTASAAN